MRNFFMGIIAIGISSVAMAEIRMQEPFSNFSSEEIGGTTIKFSTDSIKKLTLVYADVCEPVLFNNEGQDSERLGKYFGTVDWRKSIIVELKSGLIKEYTLNTYGESWSDYDEDLSYYRGNLSSIKEAYADAAKWVCDGQQKILDNKRLQDQIDLNKNLKNSTQLILQSYHAKKSAVSLITNLELFKYPGYHLRLE